MTKLLMILSFFICSISLAKTNDPLCYRQDNMSLLEEINLVNGNITEESSVKTHFDMVAQAYRAAVKSACPINYLDEKAFATAAEKINNACNDSCESRSKIKKAEQSVFLKNCKLMCGMANGEVRTFVLGYRSGKEACSNSSTSSARPVSAVH